MCDREVEGDFSLVILRLSPIIVVLNKLERILARATRAAHWVSDRFGKIPALPLVRIYAQASDPSSQTQSTVVKMPKPFRMFEVVRILGCPSPKTL